MSIGAAQGSHNDHTQTGKILLVEDDEGNALFLRMLIELAGYECAQAKSGGAALRMLSEETYDLILLDLHLPDMDGYSIATSYQNDKAGNTPIVGISAEAGAQTRKRCLEAGMKDLCFKGAEPETIQDMINTYAHH